MNENLITSDKANAGLNEDEFIEMRHDTDVIAAMINRGIHFYKVMDRLNKFADKWIPRAYIKPQCKKGCSYCCHVKVALTALEAAYIQDRTGKPITNIKSSEDLNFYKKPENRPCVFLKDNLCSIYEHRPMACRAFLTFDSVEYCKQGGHVEHWLLALNEPGQGGFEALNGLYYGVMVHYLKCNPELQQFNDIREFFKYQ